MCSPGIFEDKKYVAVALVDLKRDSFAHILLQFGSE